MSDRLLTDEWQEGYDARRAGMVFLATLHARAAFNATNREEYRQHADWLDGYRSAQFEERDPS